MTETAGNYDAFKQRQRSLLALLEQGRAVFQGLDMRDWADTMDRLASRVASETFKVIILGEFKRGKSTFINALLGEEVLPAFSWPCTAVINEIKWSDKKKAILHFRNPLPNPLPDIPKAALKHVQAGHSPTPPMMIGVEEIEEYVVIPDPGKDQAESVAETPYDHVEICWPLQICKNGVEIIDSPGLNEHGVRQKITLDYLSNIDAVVFVLSCHALASQSEMRVIDQEVRGAGHEDIFIICNRFDEIRQKERDRLVMYGQQKLAPKTNFGEAGVYFVSAKQALEGRLDKDQDRVDTSGFSKLESDLSRFLVNDRGKVKLLQPARELTLAIHDTLLRRIPAQKKMLREDLQKLEARYKEQLPLLKDAERRRDQIMRQMHHDADRLRKEISDNVSHWMKDQIDEISKWAQTYQPKNTIKFIAKSTRPQIEALVKEVAEHLQGRLQDEQDKWRSQVLSPLLEKRLNSMTEAVDPGIRDLLERIDNIRAGMAGLKIEDLRSDETKEAKPLERVLAAAGGFLIGGIGAALVGGALGYKAMAQALVPQIGLVIGMILLGVVNPFVFIGVLLTAGSIQGFLQVKATGEKVKMRVAEEMITKIRENAGNCGEDVAGRVKEHTDKIIQAIGQGLEREIQAVRDQVEAVLEDKREGDEKVAARLDSLETSEQELKQIASDVSAMVFQLAEP